MIGEVGEKQGRERSFDELDAEYESCYQLLGLVGRGEPNAVL
jgi:hypothetical protein